MIKHPIPQTLTKKYPAALYSYFRVTNLLDSFEKFMQSPAQAPKFSYSVRASEEKTRERLKNLKADRSDTSLGQKDITFIDWRVAEANVLLDFWWLKNAKRITEHDVNAYLAAQIELYGPMDASLFSGVLANIQRLAKQRGSHCTQLLGEIDSLLGKHSKKLIYEPSPRTFNHYKKILPQAFPGLMAVINDVKDSKNYDDAAMVSLFENALAAVGADKKGWSVRQATSGANIVTSKYRQQIVIGNNFKPLNNLRLKQVVLHEVGCHVQMALSHGADWRYPRYNESDEGLAIILEQLLDERFVYKRALRYLAICLAAGIDGKKRNFVEVFEIMWRAVCIVGGQDTQTAKKQGFYETARAFRGGLPEVAGIAYIKDKVYLEGNIKAWQQLEAKRLSAQDFRELFVKAAQKGDN